MPDSSWTETGSSISLIPTTTPIDPGSSPANANYLTNAYKAALMQQYAGELAMKTSLDSLATTWGCSATAYNNAVAAINTTITGFSGAPANWATIWPDGTMSGPWLGVQTLLSSNWSAIATQRTALQAAIGAAQAAAAQATAISTAVAQALASAPVQVASLPTLPNAAYPAGRIVWNTADGYLYVSAGSTWTALTIAAANISGTLAAAQIASLAASQVTGQLSDSQLAAISAAKLTGQITGTQITNGAISTPLLAAGAVTAATIAADTITASQIAASAITATELAAGAVVAGKIAAGTIQAADIAAATITGANIAATTITAANIAADTLTAAQIAAGAITATELAAGSVTTAKLAAGAVTAATIAAGAITGDMITTGTLNAANVAVTNLNASNITTGTLSASKVLFADGTALTTASRVQTTILTQSTTASNSGTGSVAIPGLSGTFTIASANDVYNFFSMFSGHQTSGTVPNTNASIILYVDGSPVKANAIVFNSLNQTQQFTLIWSLTGLSAGSHTISFYLSTGGVSGQPIQTFLGSTVMVQRIF